MTVEQLKARAYDILVQIENLKIALQQTNKAIAEKMNEKPIASTAPDAK